MSKISSQQRQLESALRDSGWEIIDRTTDLPWWGDESWTIRSQWRPVGLTAFVVFTICPLTLSQVDAVECLSEWPRSESNTIVEVSLTHWDKKQAEIISALMAFRDR
ncbi:MAG: hypothetical protein HKN47_22265 [Pirellulaceae bacterium]|nr:hypothetical protein [Pirellulaceae bacterium]